MEIRFLGSLYGHGTGYAGAVFDKEHLSPTLSTMQGGGKEPHIIESRVIGGLGEKKSNNGTQYFQQDRVYTMGDIALSQTANLPDGSNKYMEIKVLGNYTPSDYGGSRVLDPNGIAQTVRECHGVVTGTVESKVLGRLNENSNQRTQVYDTEQCSPTSQAVMGTGGGNMPYMVEKKICAARGRNPDNPSDRTKGIYLEQTLEINEEDTANCLTTVYKDNMVMEKAIVDDLNRDERVYSEYSPSLRSERTGLKVVAIDEQNMNVNAETVGTLTTDGSSPKHNNRVAEIEGPVIYIKQATKDGFIPLKVRGVADTNYLDSTTRRGRVVEGGQISPTLTTENIPDVFELAKGKFGEFLYAIDGCVYLIRIRKLTPHECWSLMDFSTENYLKAELVNSNTQLYKQAGNSIVQNCLVGIIGQMIDGRENVYKERFQKGE